MITNNPYIKKDEQLFAEVQKLKEGDFSNSNAVYELSEKYIYKIINDIVKNHHTTEDLMQEAYIQIYNKINTLQEVKAFYVWAGRIATNLTLRYIQKNSKEVLVVADEEGDTDFIFDTASEDNEKFIPESVLVDREKQRLIAEIIDKLSIEQKICIQYFYYEEMSVNQIAEAMGCSTGTIKSRLNYARKSIKEAVVELDEKHGTRLYSLASAPLFLIIFRAAVEGLLPAAVAGAASAVAVGGASVVSGASSVGGVSSVGNVAGVGGVSSVGNAASVGGASASGSVAKAGASAKTLNTASIAEKSVNVTEKGPSASRIEEVKNLVIEKLKKMGGNIKTDVKKISEAAKGTAKEHGTKIKGAFQTGKKEGAKQILESAGKCTVIALKGIGACTVTTKVVMAAIVVILVIPKNAGHLPVPMEDPIVLEDPIMMEESVEQEEEIVEEVVEDIEEVEQIEEVKEVKPIEFDILIETYRFKDGRVYYGWWYDENIIDTKMDLTPNALVFETQDWHNYENLELSSWPQGMYDELFNYTEQFFNKGKADPEIDNMVSFYSNDVSKELLVEIDEKEYIYTIDSVSGHTILFGYGIHREVLNGDIISVEGSYGFNVRLRGYVVPANDSEKSQSNESVNGTSSATTHPDVTGILDPSEIEGITVPELEAKLPTVEAIREIEQMQTILYVEYSRTNMTDEAFYSLMEQVPCTVYLQDGSSHSVTLAEFIFKDWSSYADLNKLDYDSNKARELSEGYKTTDSLMGN